MFRINKNLLNNVSRRLELLNLFALLPLASVVAFTGFVRSASRHEYIEAVIMLFLALAFGAVGFGSWTWYFLKKLRKR